MDTIHDKADTANRIADFLRIHAPAATAETVRSLRPKSWAALIGIAQDSGDPRFVTLTVPSVTTRLAIAEILSRTEPT